VVRSQKRGADYVALHHGDERRTGGDALKKRGNKPSCFAGALTAGNGKRGKGGSVSSPQH